MNPNFKPQFQHLFALVNERSAQLIDEVLHPENQRALLITRGKLSALQTQADILRYHLNRNLCRREDVEYLISCWGDMTKRLWHLADVHKDIAPYLEAAADTLLDGTQFLVDALVHFEHQLGDDGDFHDGGEHCQPPVAVGAVLDTPQEDTAANS